MSGAAGSFPRSFEPPGPGSWVLDASHCSKPRSRWLHDVFGRVYESGFRAGFERYGAMLDTIAYAPVNGFPYTNVRPLGAPPGAKGPPPRLVLKLLSWLHPALRGRIKRAEVVWRDKPWRCDLRALAEQTVPKTEATLLALSKEEIATADVDDLVAHVEAAYRVVEEGMRDHFTLTGGTMIPVGDYLAHLVAWTGCRADEALSLLRGTSPASVEGVREIDAVLAALEHDAAAKTIIDEAAPASERLDKLRALPGPAGDAVRAWLDRAAHRVLTGHDVADLTGIELPEVLLGSLSSRDRGARGAEDDTASKTAAMRERVPAEYRSSFDELLEEARAVYSLRDGRCTLDFWRFGVARRAILEAGRRLAAAGRLERADQAVDLTHAEIVSMLRGGDGPSSAEIAQHARWREQGSVRDAPEVLGAPPSPPPASDWLPKAAARIDRAFATYLDAMWSESAARQEATLVRGIPASAGRYVGTARVVVEPKDFSRVERGDVLVAWITTPTYNVLMPLLGAVVTDRGGPLSHPAIVSREFGIPGVVGCREATKRIRDGARVEVDGELGTVRVLA